MSDNNYLNLFVDAGISDRRDQEKYVRCLDTVLAQEGITVGDIAGVGEKSAWTLAVAPAWTLEVAPPRVGVCVG